jgi:hypothetical protein
MKKADLDSSKLKKLYDEVRLLLIYQAQKNQPIGYGKLCGKITAVKINSTDPALHDVLGEVSVDECRKGNGMLSVFCGVEDKDLYLPGKGFFKQAMDLGNQVGNWESFVKSERAKVHQAFRDQTVLTFD